MSKQQHRISSSSVESESVDLLHLSDSFAISVSAPGKVILYGEHSVVYDKVAIAASLGLRTKLSLRSLPKSNTANIIKIELAPLNLIHSYDINDIQSFLLSKASQCNVKQGTHHNNWENPDSFDHAKLLNLVKNFVDHSSGSFPLSDQQNFSLWSLFYLLAGIVGSNVDIKPFSLQIDTDLSIGAGTGSSASYSVTLAAAFIQYIRINVTDHSNNLKRLTQFDAKELELISKWAFLAEKIIHGSPSGIDNAICTFGSIVKFQRNNGLKFIKIQHELKLLLINTKVQRNTGVLVKSVATWKERHLHVIDAILNSMDKVSHDALKYLQQLSIADVPVEQEEEIHSKLRDLMDINQYLLQCLRVSHPTLERICAILKSKNLCGKLTGAGGGGYAIALIPSNFSAESIKNVIEELNSEGFEATLTSLGGPGVTIDSN